MFYGLGATATVVLMVFGVLMAVLWIFAPFAIFKTARELESIRRQQEVTNNLLRELVRRAGGNVHGP